MPDFLCRNMIATYARYIVRHGLLIWWEIDRQTMTLKLHKVAQSGLRRRGFKQIAREASNLSDSLHLLGLHYWYVVLIPRYLPISDIDFEFSSAKSVFSAL